MILNTINYYKKIKCGIMFEELHEFLEDKGFQKNELLAILKAEKAQKISVFDLMEANQYILQDVEFISRIKISG